MPDLDKLVGDLATEHDSLDAIVRGVSTEDWDEPTPAEGWSVRDQISHLAFFDDQARLATDDPDGFTAHLSDIAADPDAFMNEPLVEGRTWSPEKVLDNWRRARSE